MCEEIDRGRLFGPSISASTDPGKAYLDRTSRLGRGISSIVWRIALF